MLWILLFCSVLKLLLENLSFQKLRQWSFEPWIIWFWFPACLSRYLPTASLLDYGVIHVKSVCRCASAFRPIYEYGRTNWIIKLIRHRILTVV
jgi:hypothetical protein